MVSGLNERTTAADDALDNSNSSLIISGREKESLINKIKSQDTDGKIIKTVSVKQSNKVKPEEPKEEKLCEHDPRNPAMRQSRIMRLLKEAVTNKFPSQAVMHLEK